MSDELRLDPDALRQDGARLAELGDRVGRTYARLQHGLAAADGCWGDDDLGEAFARDFTPHADQLLAGLRAMQESLRGVAQQVANSAHDFESQDLHGASRIGRAANGALGVEPDYGTGAQPPSALAPAPTQGPQTPSSATVSASRDSASTGRSPSASDLAGQPAPGRTPEASPGGLSASQNSPQSSNPSPQAPDRRGGAKPAGDPSRLARADGVSPPAGRDAPRGPDAATARPGPTPARDAAPATGARRQTPWNEPSTRPSRGSTTADPQSSNPRSGTPPRPARGGEQRKRDRQRDREPSAGTTRVAPPLAWLARTLADRHGVTVVGFGLPGLQETPVRQFAAAIDRVLTDYPVIDLDVVAVGELGDDADSVLWRHESHGSAAVRSITLDRRVAGDDSGTPESEGASDDPAVYAATVRELGLALNSTGGDVARRAAQHTLIGEYMRTAAGRYTTLAQLLRGYRQWRAELPGATGEAGEFDGRRAVGAAFADVVLHGRRASAPAKALHAALVDAAPPPG
ncbi:hypothetical protein [Nocardia africana]